MICNATKKFFLGNRKTCLSPDKGRLGRCNPLYDVYGSEQTPTDTDRDEDGVKKAPKLERDKERYRLGIPLNIRE